MKIYLCQTSPKAGDLSKNHQIIVDLYQKAFELNANICLFPELSTSGYMAGDLFLQEGFLSDIQQMVSKLVEMTKSTCLLLPTAITDPVNSNLYNGVIAAQYGRVIGISYKQELPNHGIFNEKRYFARGEPNIITIDGVKVGVPICEDIWHPEVCKKLQNEGAQIFLVPNGSPYEKKKMSKRIDIVQQRYNETNIPMIYCNQILGQDGIIFDGKSFCYDGDLQIIGKGFEIDQALINVVDNKLISSHVYDQSLDIYREMFDAMILGLRDYVKDNNFAHAILGLSGGIDSAIVAIIAKEALGAENVTAYMLPSQFTSKISLQDAQEVASIVGIQLELINIANIITSFSEIASIKQDSIAYQNLQSRIRGTILMAKANELNSLLITTGNKSEYAIGYTTIYGDMNGAFNPIKDIYKTELYNLAIYINQYICTIPQSILTKEPSAELAYNQKDSDSLPKYSELDKILEDHIENGLNCAELSLKYGKHLATRIVQLIKNSEFKRKQSAPGVKISTTSFDKDRRFPTTNFYH